MISTIGYEQAELADFIATLRREKVALLIDIRDRAQSRRKGFSKTALSEALEQAGIEYLHFRSLGDPKEGREAARSGNLVRFRSIYRAVMKSPSAQTALEEISKVAKTASLCLMCYERDHQDCHRKMVADHLEGVLGIKVRHLRVKAGGGKYADERRVLHRHQGAAA